MWDYGLTRDIHEEYRLDESMEIKGSPKMKLTSILTFDIPNGSTVIAEIEATAPFRVWRSGA